MAGSITYDQLVNMGFDAKSWEEYWEGTITDKVVTRLGKEYPTHERVLQIMVENGLYRGTMYSTKAELDAALDSADDLAYAVVTDDRTGGEPTEYNGFYQKQAGAWVYLAWNPVQQFLIKLQEVLQQANQYTDEQVITEKNERLSLINNGDRAVFTDEYGFLIAEILNNSVFKVLLESDMKFVGGKIADKYGFGVDLIDCLFNMKIKSIAYRDSFGFGFNLVDEILRLRKSKNTVITNLDKILFSDKLATWSNESIDIYIPHLLTDREQQIVNNNCIAVITNTQKNSKTMSDQILTIRPIDYSGDNYIYIRNKSLMNNRSRLFFKLLPVNDSSNEIKIHMLGDSITEMGGIPITKKILENHGMTVTAIGTYRSNAAMYENANLTGVVGEGRGGWRAADYTNSRDYGSKVTDASVYLALSNPDKKAYNPYLREATESDSPDIVRNGYVFDFSNYLTKFSLTTPDVVYIGLGTNDLNAYSESVFASGYEADMRLLIMQIKSAGVTKIILGQPAPVIIQERNEKWRTHYQVGIRILIKLAKELACIFVPIHCVAPNESGFTFAVSSTDFETGTERGDFSDALHPWESSRFSIYNLVASTMSAAKQNLI